MIPVNEPLLTNDEKDKLIACIETGWISFEGPFVREFEKSFSEYNHREYGIAVSSGSAALDVAVAALQLEKEDEVIIPSFTIISCVSAVVRSGATPVLVDADPLTWNMDVNQLENLITARTKAIMAVHTYGLPVDMDKLQKIANTHKLKIIEDAAEAIGQTYKNKLCGSFGDISIFSFYPNKHITTGEGGMILTDDLLLAERCRKLRNLYFGDTKRYVHEELGWNYRMTNMQAGLGLAQLEKLDQSLKRKREIGNYYTELLSDIPGIQLPLPETSYAENIYWVFGLLLKEEIPFDAEWIIQKLRSLDIGSRAFFYPMHLQPVFNKMRLFYKEKYPVSEFLSRRGLYLPSGLTLTNKQIKEVSDALHKILA